MCDYSGAHILVAWKITITGSGDDAAGTKADERNKGVIFGNCALFIKCWSKIIHK